MIWVSRYKVQHWKAELGKDVLHGAAFPCPAEKMLHMEEHFLPQHHALSLAAGAHSNYSQLSSFPSWRVFWVCVAGFFIAGEGLQMWLL